MPQPEQRSITDQTAEHYAPGDTDEGADAAQSKGDADDAGSQARDEIVPAPMSLLRRLMLPPKVDGVALDEDE